MPAEPYDVPETNPSSSTHHQSRIGQGPQADRDLLALNALHQRQLRTALLHGSRRDWRDTRRIWPAVVIGLLLIALAVTAISVMAAFRP